jgi:hypothetical protein
MNKDCLNVTMELFFKLPCWTDDDANGEKGPTLTKGVIKRFETC